MINRANYRLLNEYLEYLRGRRLSAHTIDQQRSALRRLLEWADDESVLNADRISPSFPAYVATLGLANKTQSGTISAARGFFVWLRRAYPKRTARLSDLWIGSLFTQRPTPDAEHQAYSIDDIRALVAAASQQTMYDLRARATVSMLFTSGMRIGAFVTTPIAAIDVAARSVRQWPSLGIKTKGQKRATTFLLNIPDLLNHIAEWDALVRRSLPANCMWYAPLTIDGELVALDGAVSDRGRQQSVARMLKRLCERAGIQYLSPHKIRHGHAVYALKCCRDIADFKAVSMNLMHANLEITDGIYGILSLDDMQSRIGALK